MIKERCSLEEMPILNILRPHLLMPQRGHPPGAWVSSLSSVVLLRGALPGGEQDYFEISFLFPKGLWSASKVTRGFPGGA